MRAIALETHVLGFALSRIRMGGFYIHTFVRDLKDREAMERALDITEEAERLLEPLTGEDGLPGSFMGVGERNPEDFTRWFKEEFHNPPEYSPNSEDGMPDYFRLAGSNQDLEFLGIVMFEG